MCNIQGSHMGDSCWVRYVRGLKAQSLYISTSAADPQSLEGKNLAALALAEAA